MTDKYVLKARGLSKYSSPMSERPEGSLNVASNIVIDKDGVFSPRRGFERLAGTLSVQASAIIPYDDKLMIYSNGSLYHTDETAATFTAVSGFTSTDANIRYAEAGGNLYMTTNAGVVKMSAYNSAASEAGAPPALGGYAALYGSSGWLANTYWTAYRVVWGIEDANDTIYLGAPSASIYLYNGSGGARDGVLSFYVPDEVTTSHFYRVYRTAGSSTSDTGDEMGLVYEGTYAEYTGFTFTDATISPSITKADHGLVTGVAVSFTTTGSLAMTGITVGVEYYVIRLTSSTIGLATSPAAAFAGTAISLYPTGSGTHTLVVNNNLINVLDQTADDLRGAALYTNATQEGIAQANDQPPKCSDMAVYSNHLFFADVTYRHTLEFSLLATGGSRGLIADDTVVITGTVGGSPWTQTYTAKGTESVASQQFLAAVASPADPAYDVRVAAESLVKCINGNPANTTVYAYYTSGESDLPGKIMLTERDFGGSAFTVTSSRGGAWSPSLATPGKASSAESYSHYLAYSKESEYEAVPRANYLEVGSRAYAIKRIVALRDSLFIFKEDGIYRLTGSSASNFSVETFDNSTRLVASNSVVVLNNLIFGLFDQGVCTISESGVSIVSREIEGDLKLLQGDNLTNYKNLTFGVPYETDRKYLMWLSELSADLYPTVGYVYNVMTSSWTTYDKAAKAGVVNPVNDKLYLAAGGQVYLSRERKAYSRADYADEQLTVTALSASGYTVTLSDVSGIDTDDIYYESANKFSRILSIDTALNKLTLESDLDWSGGSAVCSVLRSYLCTIEWNPIHLGQPANMKQFSEGTIVTSKPFGTCEISFRSDMSRGWGTSTVTGTSFGLWGLGLWGQVPWGGTSDVVSTRRTYVPREKQRANALYLKFETDTCYVDWEVSGIELKYRPSTGRSGR